MRRIEPVDRSRTRQLLATTSLVALLAVAATPRALAQQCATTLGPGTVPGCTNSAGTTLTRIAITNATVTSTVSNAGVITPGGITLTDSTFFSANIFDTGTITGGIALDAQSEITNVLAGDNAIMVFTAPTFGGGISNAGTLSAASGNGILVADVSNFTGGITNSGTISAFSPGTLERGSDIVIGFQGGDTAVVSTFTGGIANSGRLIAVNTAILVANVDTFTGGIANSGIVTATATNAGGIVINRVNGTSQIVTISSFGGDIANSGTISVGGIGIGIDVYSTAVTNGGIIGVFSGSIVNGSNGVIDAGATGIYVAAVSSFSGSIGNSGTISAAGGPGIFVQAVSLFSGGVSNAGSILAAKTGIAVGASGTLTIRTGTAVGAVTTVHKLISTFAGGVTNSGTISAAAGNGIFVEDIDTFAGGISNSGTIENTIGAGFEGGIAVAHIETFAGGIDNSGVISMAGLGASAAGILLYFVSGGGGITNSGTISSADGGVALDNATFAGGITNSGTLTGVEGIAIVDAASLANGITNSGRIAVSGAGIDIFDATVSGGITNSGTIAARTGIFFGTDASLSGAIVNSGNISGTAAAIDLTGAESAVTIDQEGGTITGAIDLSPNGDTLNISGGAIAGNIVGQNAGDTINFALGAGTFTYANTISQVNTINVNSGTVQLDGTISAATSGTALTIAAPGTLLVGTGGSVAPNVTDNGTFGFNQSGAYTYSAIISGTGIVEQLGPGTTMLTGINGYSGGTVIDGGTLMVFADDNLGNASGGLSFGGGTLLFLGPFTSARTVTLNAGGGSFDTGGTNDALSGTIGGVGGLTKIGAGILRLSGTSSYTGATDVNAGALQAGSATAFAPQSTFTVASGAILDLNGFNQSIGALAGAGNVTLGSATLTAGGDNASTTYSGAISGSGGFDKAGTGTLVLSGTDSYSGATDVDEGTLEVDGTLSDTSSVAVSGGATLSGDGTIDPLTVTIAGTLSPGIPNSPGTAMTIVGNLAFQSGALYVIYLNPSATTMANVSGTASLAGTVEANFLSGAYVNNKPYDILHSAGLGGTTFAGAMAVNGPNFDVSLSYTATDVYLDLTAALGSGTPLNQNQRNVAAVVNNSFNSGSTLPTGFGNLFNLSGVALANALSQLDGEDATGAETSSFQLMNEFLGLMLDPFVDGRGGSSTTGGALGFAPDQQASLPPDVALAYAGLLKAPPAPTFQQRWTTWAAGFGGSSTTNGDPTVGSNNVTTSTYGYAAGADYHVSPDTVLGFSLAGGGTNWNLANALGTGRSDAFLAGLYGVTHQGPWYLGAALAFANNWFTTNRTALGDQLTANFQGQSYAARIEGGYRLVVPVYHSAVGVTPYAALQAQNFHTPAYSETDLSGGGFGLSYNAMNGTDTRSELGSRFDDLTTLDNLPLILRAKLAWAHDWVSNPALNASFEALPGSSFTVNGAPIPKNSALTSAGAQLFFTPNWSLLAKFDGEFAGGSQLYAGSGTLRYTW